MEPIKILFTQLGNKLGMLFFDGISYCIDYEIVGL